MKTCVTAGYDAENNIPIKLYFNKEYINHRLEFSVNVHTWKVYFYGAPIGYVSSEGGIVLNEERDN